MSAAADDDTASPLAHALAYAARGWRVAPVRPGTKWPRLDAWQTHATTDPDTIRAWWARWPADGVSIITGRESGIFVLDVDPRHGGDDTIAELATVHGPLPATVEALTGGGGRHLYYRMPDGQPITNDAGNLLGPGLDVRGEGGQVVAPPTVHPDTGRPYAWEALNDPLEGVAVADAPDWLVTLLTRPQPAQAARRERLARPDGSDLPGDWFAATHTWPELLEADGWTLHSVRDDGTRFELWTRPGKDRRDGPSASLYYGGSDVLKVFTSSLGSLGLTAGETYTRFGYHAARHHGGDHAAAAGALRRSMPDALDRLITAPPAPPAHAVADGDGGGHDVVHTHTDLGNARRLVDAHGATLRHAPQLGAWLAWDGARWAEDVTGDVVRRAKETVDAMATQLVTDSLSVDERKDLAKHWLRSCAAPRLEAMISLARTEPGMPVLVDHLDGDPWALNVINGSIDLRTGVLHPHDRNALHTKLAPVTYDPDATCPTWEWFVDWAMRSDAELVAFLQRAIGYSLTGHVGEQVLFFCHGAGANGKSTMLGTMHHILGDYAVQAEPELLLASDHAKHPTGLVDLMGGRFVVAQEIEDGRRLAESTVKQLTGGDLVKARRMRQDFFTFHPTHKLWMAANHKPGVRGTDHAIWRRIRLIPFTATVTDVDDRLPDKLRAEAAGILNWAIRGCLDWQANGLRPPAAVLDATSGYRIEQDHVGRFLSECCELDPDASISAKDLRRCYEEWCAEMGERPWSAKAMGAQLTDRGLDREKSGRANTVSWIGLRAIGAESPTQGALINRAERESGDRGPFGPSPGYPPSARADGSYTDDGPNGPRPSAGADSPPLGDDDW